MISRTPSRLAKQHQFTKIRPEIVLLGSNGRIIDEQDRLTGLLDAPLSQRGITWTSPFLNPFMHTSVMFRTDIIRDRVWRIQCSLSNRAGLRAMDARDCRLTKVQIFPNVSYPIDTSQHRCQSLEATWRLQKQTKSPHERRGAFLGASLSESEARA